MAAGYLRDAYAGPVGDDGRRTGEALVLAGLGAVAVAATGWLGTVIGTSFAAQPEVTEDLTPAWSAAGTTALGGSATVTVPPGQTLVAFLVGTDLTGIAGTTTGTCSAESGAGRIDLSWPVLLNFSVTGLLGGDREAVAIDGWRNTGSTAAAVDISCDTRDSTVEGFVAVSSATAAIPRDPWFQPWGWLALGAAGAGLAAAGVLRLPRE